MTRLLLGAVLLSTPGCAADLRENRSAADRACLALYAQARTHADTMLVHTTRPSQRSLPCVTVYGQETE